MSIQLNEKQNGKILEVEVSGKLAAADYKHFVPEFERLVQKHGRISVLFDMKDFHGWEPRALWEDIKFDARHFSDIDRLAMVGEKKWESAMADVCRPFTKAAIRYFDRTEAERARQWIEGRQEEQVSRPSPAPAATPSTAPKS